MSKIITKKINDFFTYKNKILFVEDVSVMDISKRINTPFYIYSSASLRRRYTQLSKSLKNINHSLYFSVKSNSNLAVLRVLSLLGSGMDVVSGGEYLRAQKAGVPGDKIVFSGVGKTYDEIKLALSNGIRQFNVESIPEIMLINKIAATTGKKAPISIRVNPDVDAQTHEKIMTGKLENKFGIPINSALEVYRIASELNSIKIVGIDLHIGSQITEIKPFDLNNLIEWNVVQGGMIPKIKNCVDAVENGVRGVVILDGRKPHSILHEIFSDKGAGTLIRK